MDIKSMNNGNGESAAGPGAAWDWRQQELHRAQASFWRVQA